MNLPKSKYIRLNCMNVVKSKCNDQVDGYLTTDIDSAKNTWCNKILRKSKEK